MTNHACRRAYVNHSCRRAADVGRQDRALLPGLAGLAVVLVFLSGQGLSAEESDQARASGRIEFNRDIKPILSEHCFACHGPDENTREADLRLDLRPAAVEAAIVPGRVEESELILRVMSEDPDLKMPPSETPPLNSQQIERLRRWVDQGALYQQHWAYIPPRRPLPPPVARPEWPAGVIDQFVLARLEQEGLQPSPRADHRTLIRRLSLDLIGLPPSPDEVSRFVQDRSPGAYERLVDRLLASPRYGERMAMYWLDVARYADSVGIHGDQELSMSPYRDYVISAFNRNLPLDQFITEQIAGDLLPEATVDQKVASAFNRLHMITAEGGAQEKEYLAKYAADRVRNTGSAILGSTMGCAECHDHKFDPFTMEDFYRMAAFFADLKEKGVYSGNSWIPQMPVPTAQQKAAIERLEREIQQLRQESETPTDEPPEQVKKLEARLADLRKSVPTVLVSLSVAPRVMRILPRGNWLDESGEVVQPGAPRFLTSRSAEGRRATRRDLARWLTDRQNPLTARVFVNRLWKLAWGHGIVSTLDDFGSQGSWPTHPELLDWLSVEFMERGWDVKHTLKLIVLSEAYRQSSLISAELRDRDPENRRLARQNRFRLDAEKIRDNALSISGLLVHRLGGRSVKPYQPAGYYAHLNFPKRTYQQDHGENLYRRTVYTHWQRTFLHPSLLAFDAPTREECTVQRDRSNTPVQSLVLLNDPIYVEAARVFATRMIRQGGGTTSSRIAFAFDWALGRAPRLQETEILRRLVDRHREHFARNPDEARKLLTVGEWPVPEGIPVEEIAAWTTVARTILNLHETVTRT